MAGMRVLVMTMKSGHVQEAKLTGHQERVIGVMRARKMSHSTPTKKGWMKKLVAELNTVRRPIFLGRDK